MTHFDHQSSNATVQQIEAEQLPLEIYTMDDLNGMPKYPDAGQPFGPIVFQYDGRMWWALDPVKKFAGFGFFYPTLREAIRRWNVTITSCVNGAWSAVARPALAVSLEPAKEARVIIRH